MKTKKKDGTHHPRRKNRMKENLDRNLKLSQELLDEDEIVQGVRGGTLLPFQSTTNKKGGQTISNSDLILNPSTFNSSSKHPNTGNELKSGIMSMEGEDLLNAGFDLGNESEDKQHEQHVWDFSSPSKASKIDPSSNLYSPLFSTKPQQTIPGLDLPSNKMNSTSMTSMITMKTPRSSIVVNEQEEEYEPILSSREIDEDLVKELD